MRILRQFRRLAAMGIVAAASTTCFAQEYYSGEQTVTVSATSLNDMMSRLDALEAAIGNDVAKAGVGKDGMGGKDGWVDTHNEGWSHKWGGRIMGDYVLYSNQDAGSTAKFGDLDNYFEMRRLRFFVEGDGYGVYDYKLQVDFEPENGFVTMKDAFFGIHEVPFLGYVRFGHYKAPASLEELTSSKYITFMERSLGNVFIPGREVGVTAYQVSQDQNVTWAYGVYFDDINEGTKQRVNDNQGTTMAARATYLPVYDEPSNGRYLVHTGISFVWTDPFDDTVQFTSRPEVHEGPNFVGTAAIAADRYYTVNPEFAWVNGPLSLQSEYMYTQVNTVAGPFQDYHAAYIQASYFLTGEHRQYSRGKGTFTRVRPHENFWVIPGCVGSGAVELAARWSYLDLSGGGDPLSGTENNVTLGANWYWNPYLRWMFNYIHSWNEYDNGDPNAETDIFAIRGQIDF